VPGVLKLIGRTKAGHSRAQHQDSFARITVVRQCKRGCYVFQAPSLLVVFFLILFGALCTGPNPGGKPLWYQKHMTMHMVPAFDRSFLRHLSNAFLIRHPARVFASYARKREAPTLEDVFIHLMGQAQDNALAA